MSKRSSVIVGTILITGLVVGWNAATSALEIPTPAWQPSIGTWVVSVVAWYVINWFNSIKEWNRRPVLLFGRYIKTAGPGLVPIEPLFYTTLPDVPVQDVVKDVKAPSVQTKDNVSVGIEAVLTYRVDAAKVKDVVVEVQRAEDAILKRALSTMNDVGSITDLDQFLEHRDKFGNDVVTKLRERVSKWGVIIQALELKFFKINDSHVEQAIAMKARAHKEASAELVRANMQKQIATALNEAAKELDEKGWTLKGMEILIEMCRSANNNTILIPSDVQSGLGSLMAMRGLPTTSPKSTTATAPAVAAKAA